MLITLPNNRFENSSVPVRRYYYYCYYYDTVMFAHSYSEDNRGRASVNTTNNTSLCAVFCKSCELAEVITAIGAANMHSWQ